MYLPFIKLYNYTVNCMVFFTIILDLLEKNDYLCNHVTKPYKFIELCYD